MLTRLSVFLFLLSGLLIAMACVKAHRVRSWRTSLNPSAPDIPDAAFIVARFLLVGFAVGGVIQGFQGLAVADGQKWSDDELTSAVEQATYELDGFLHRVDESGEPVAAIHDYETLIETEVAENGGGDAPQDGVGADPALGNTDADAYFEVTANGAGTEFCTHIKRVRSKKDDYTPPGLDGGSWTQLGYRLAVTSKKGAC
ncbi:hypothetical protein ACWGH5_37500 [Streptomyces sp. NPDC054864]